MSAWTPKLIKAVALLIALVTLGFLSCTASKSSDQKAILHERLRKATDPESTPGELSDLFTNITLELQGMTNSLSKPNARADKALYAKLRYGQVTLMLLAMNSSLPPDKLPELEKQFQTLRENACYIPDFVTTNSNGELVGVSTNQFNTVFGPKAGFNNLVSPSYDEVYIAWEVLTRMQNGDEMWGTNPFFSEHDIRTNIVEEGFQANGECNDLWAFSLLPFRYLTQDIILEMWNAPNLSTNQLRTIRANIASTKALDQETFERIIRSDDDPAYPSDLLIRLSLSQNRNLPPDLALELLVNNYYSFKHGALVEADLSKIYKGLNVDVFKGTDLDPQTGLTNYWAKGPNGKVYLQNLPSYWDVLRRTLQSVPKSEFSADVIPNLNNLIKARMVHVDSSDTNMVYLVPGPQREEWVEEFRRGAGNSNAAYVIGCMFIGSMDQYRQDINDVLKSLEKPKLPRGSFFTTPFGKFIGDSLDEGLREHPEGKQIGPHDNALELFRENRELLLSLPGTFPFPPRTGDLYEDIKAVVEKARAGVPQGKPSTMLPPHSLTLHNTSSS